MITGKDIASRVVLVFNQQRRISSIHVDSFDSERVNYNDISFVFRTKGNNLDILLIPPLEASEGFGAFLEEVQNPKLSKDSDMRLLHERQKRHKKHVKNGHFYSDDAGMYHFRATINPYHRDITYIDKLTLGVIDYAVSPGMLFLRRLKKG